MDLQFFLNPKFNPKWITHLRGLTGLYIVTQNQLPPYFKDRYFRCGASGTREIRDGEKSNKPSSLSSRMYMYYGNWITSGTLHAFLSVPRSVFSDFSEKQLPKTHKRDQRPAYAKALKGKTRLMLREHEFHAKLDKHTKVTRARGDRVEWFVGELDTLKRCLMGIGTGDFYEFTGNEQPIKTTLKRMSQGKLDKKDHIVKVLHRRSPRVEEVRMKKDDIELLRKGDKKARAAARAMAALKIDMVPLAKPKRRMTERIRN